MRGKREERGRKEGRQIMIEVVRRNQVLVVGERKGWSGGKGKKDDFGL